MILIYFDVMCMVCGRNRNHVIFVIMNSLFSNLGYVSLLQRHCFTVIDVNPLCCSKYAGAAASCIPYQHRLQDKLLASQNHLIE